MRNLHPFRPAALLRWPVVPVKMPFDATALNPRERQLVAKLAAATAQLDELFWQQSDPQGLALYR